MAHFSTIVLVSKQNGSDRGDPYIAQEVKETLAPYDEELQVEPYEIACDYCRNGKTEDGDDCGDCQGSGVRFSDWNPQGEWDYWIYGGRYDGLLYGKPRISQGEDDWQQWCVNNCISTDELITQTSPIIPYAIVSQNSWYERGEMAEEKWRQTALEILEQHLEHWAILCDLHC